MTESSLFSPANLVDPYPIYRRLRDGRGVDYVPEMNIHVVTRYDLVRDALRRTGEFSSKFGAFMERSRALAFNGLSESGRAKAMDLLSNRIPTPPTMLTLDEPEHTKYRSLVAALFTGSQVKKGEDDVRRTVARNIAAMQACSRGDFMTIFAFPVPLEVIADRLGIPDGDKAFFCEAATAAASGLKLAPVDEAVMLRRLQLGNDLQQLLIGLIEARRADPHDDMITILARGTLEGEGRPLSHGEALSILDQFLVAGHETTTSTFGWGMLQLCERPALQDEIRGNEKKIRTFVEETLRIEAPVQGLPRVVTRDTELGGVALRAGDMIMLRYGAANRDERQFADPDRIDLDRDKPGMQLAFGAGVHHCIGAPLARQELNLGFRALLDHFEGFRLDTSMPHPAADPSILLRGLPRLHVTWQSR